MCYKHVKLLSLQRRRQDFGSGGGILGGRPRRGSGGGGGAPRTPENFENLQKKFLKKIAKNELY